MRTFLILASMLFTSSSYASDVTAEVIPAGVMLPFTGPIANIPKGYIACDTVGLSRAKYARLFRATGCAHGCPSGTTFNTIKMAGRFARFVDRNSANDPDRASRSAPDTGGNSGNLVGSLQSSAYASHNHTEGYRSRSSLPGAFGVSGGQSGPSWTFSFQSSDLGNNNVTSSAGGNETRPLNTNVECIVKY